MHPRPASGRIGVYTTVVVLEMVLTAVISWSETAVLARRELSKGEMMSESNIQIGGGYLCLPRS